MRAVQCLLCHWCVYELTIGCVVATVVLMVIGKIKFGNAFSELLCEKDLISIGCSLQG